MTSRGCTPRDSSGDAAEWAKVVEARLRELESREHRPKAPSGARRVERIGLAAEHEVEVMPLGAGVRTTRTTRMQQAQASAIRPRSSNATRDVDHGWPDAGGNLDVA